MNLGIWIALFTNLFLAIFFIGILVGSREQRKAAQERERRRRMVDHEMNARLLRLNL